MDKDKSIEVTPEQIRAGAWELWEWLGDGRSQNEPITLLDKVVRQIIAAVHSEEGAASKMGVGSICESQKLR